MNQTNLRLRQFRCWLRDPTWGRSWQWYATFVVDATDDEVTAWRQVLCFTALIQALSSNITYLQSSSSNILKGWRKRRKTWRQCHAHTGGLRFHVTTELSTSLLLKIFMRENVQMLAHGAPNNVQKKNMMEICEFACNSKFRNEFTTYNFQP